VVTSILIVAVVVSIYTILGGLRAVVVTETVNTGFLLVGAIIITVYALLALPAHGIHSIAELSRSREAGSVEYVANTQSRGIELVCGFSGLTQF